MSFLRKVVLITGASSGVGAATAVEFAKEGAILALTARTLSNLEITKKNCLSVAIQHFHEPFLITADLTKDSDIERIVQETVKKFGQIDILINNAGANKYHTIETLTMDLFDFVINTNLRPVYLLTHLVIPYLEKVQGCIVNVSSMTGTRPFPNTISYGPTKAAVDHFTRCSAVELGPKRIRVNAVSPGLIAGTFQKTGGMKEELLEKMIEGAKTSYPLGRIANPEDVADAICFLASDKAKYITGVVLPVDGGKSCVSN